MTLNQLVCRAASVYPEAYVLEYWDLDKSEPRENREGGDTLAQFIAREIHDTYDADASRCGAGRQCRKGHADGRR